MNKNSIIANASWIVFCKIGQSIIALIVGMLTARYLGPSDYGLINYASSLVAFVVPVMQLGFNSIMVQELINHPEEEGETIGTAIFFSVMSALMCIGGIVIFSHIVNKGETTTNIVTLLYSVILIFQALELVQYWFQAKLKSKYTSVVMLISYFMVSCYKIWLLVTKKNIYWFAVSNAIDVCIISIVLIIVYKRLGGKSFHISIRKARNMWDRSRHFIVSSMMITIFTQTDKVMLKIMLDDSITGYYAAASTCAFITNFVFVAIFDSLRPTILEGKKNCNSYIYYKRVTSMYTIVITLALIQCICMTILAKWVIHILYGSAYEAAIPILQIVIWTTLFSYIGMSRSIWILAENLQKFLWIINLTGAIVNIILNLILIPILGGVGAALASLLTQFFTNIVLSAIIKSLRESNRVIIESLKPKYIVEVFRKIVER